MSVHSFDFRKAPPAEGGTRDDYITPGTHRFKVTKYSDADSAGGKEMHTYTLEVVGTRDPDTGKRITDRFALPNLKTDPKASLFPLQRLHAFFIAAGAKNTLGKQIKIDPARFVGRQIEAEVYDERQEARTVPGTGGQPARTFEARTVSRIGDFIDPNKKEDEDEDEDDEDEEDEDTDELDDESDEDDEEDDEDEPEPEPAPRRSRATSTATATRAAAAIPAKPAKATRTAKAAAPVEDDDDDDFPFDADDDEDEEPEPAPARRRRR